MTTSAAGPGGMPLSASSPTAPLTVDTPPLGRPALRRVAPRMRRRRATVNMRRHLARGVLRVSVLMVADLAAFAAIREALHSIRENALFSDGLAALAHSRF